MRIQSRVHASIVIVTKNDPRVLDCLAAVFRQRSRFPFDVTVVDGASTDGSRQRVEQEYGRRSDFRFIVEPGPFLRAWNQGARSSKGDVIVRLDSDTVADPDWLEALVAPMGGEAHLGWTSGLVLGPRKPQSLTQRYFHHRTVAFLGRSRGAAREDLPGWNVCYRRAALERVGFFDEWLVSSEDWDLHKRLTRAGYGGQFCEGAVLRHDHPRRIGVLLRKEKWYKTGQYQMALKYGFREMWSAFVTPVAYLSIFGLLLAGLVVRPLLWIALAALGLLAIKQVASGARERDPTFWARPFFRFVEAVGAIWGLGAGVARFGMRRRRAREA